MTRRQCQNAWVHAHALGLQEPVQLASHRRSYTMRTNINITSNTCRAYIADSLLTFRPPLPPIHQNYHHQYHHHRTRANAHLAKTNPTTHHPLPTPRSSTKSLSRRPGQQLHTSQQLHTNTQTRTHLELDALVEVHVVMPAVLGLVAVSYQHEEGGKGGRKLGPRG